MKEFLKSNKEIIKNIFNFKDYKYILNVKKRERILSKSFLEFTTSVSQDLIPSIKKIVSQIGKIDAKTEGLSGKENQRDLSIKFTWGHNHNFGHGIEINGNMANRHIYMIAEFCEAFNLSDSFFNKKSCIDVGSWTGGTTLMLKHLGASNILCLEEVKKYAKTCEILCEEIYSLDGIESLGLNIYDLDNVKNKYDIAYFAGVIYHLSDPILGLRNLFNCLKDGGAILIETAGINSKNPFAQYEGNYVFTSGNKEELNRKGWNHFFPSPKCLMLWMKEAGFEEIKTFYSPFSNRVYGFGKRNKYKDICRAGFSKRNII
tara:strand:+ start:229 stop:1179 length:951 start_codon:yes stop_codon:yes gene_type:complete